MASGQAQGREASQPKQLEGLICWWWVVVVEVGVRKQLHTYPTKIELGS